MMYADRTNHEDQLPCRCGSMNHRYSTDPKCTLNRTLTKMKTISKVSEVDTTTLSFTNRKLTLLVSSKQLLHDLKTWEPLIDHNTHDGSAFPNVEYSKQFDDICFSSAAAVDMVVELDSINYPEHVLIDESIIKSYESDQDNTYFMNWCWCNILEQYSSSKNSNTFDDEFWNN